ncbi:Relaxase/Mobilisation nuclease domain-containing protein [Chitinophaga eiseniae]|uniref:Relaxase/Mobilisation nuclease domain-containing protein n=1 Tax=Chitinophaga eiseniae TaxID=634771 RepID=A0A1T4RC11_9BACT|nr:relaxase/mobilization nuclease domain-containing protein [Chitinophaga eiseniae]SKA13602.1 Relaxase/Mobilisation nuclease domain-containing protein [Chitinophaga eiseniae]
MISKVFDGHSFYHACRYMCNKQGAEVLATEGVRGYNYKLMAEDFIDQAAQRPTKKQACFHAVLSFHPHEKPDDARIVTIAKEYLDEIGITNTQFAITKHTDKAHLHVHLIANMVNNEARSIKDNHIGLRGKKVAQKLTLKYGLIVAEKKNLALTHLEALDHSEANRYRIYTAILETLPQCRSLEELETRLKAYGIEVLYKNKGQTQERQGISFQLGKDVFKGSKVDRNFSLGNLEKTLAQNQQQVLTQTSTTIKHQQQPGPKISEEHNFAGQLVEELGNQVLHSATGILAELLKAEYVSQDTSPELLREARKKKKRKRIR